MTDRPRRTIRLFGLQQAYRVPTVCMAFEHVSSNQADTLTARAAERAARGIIGPRSAGQELAGGSGY